MKRSARVLCLLLLSAAAGAPPRALAADVERVNSWSEEDLKFFFDDIYDPFFVERKDASVQAVMVTARARAQEVRFSKEKPKGTFRIFVLGGSVAQRYMENQNYPINRDRDQAELWEKFLPGRKVETISAAVPSYDSAREVIILKEVLQYSPDLVVLLSGNNEKDDPTFAPNRLYKIQGRLRRLDWYRALQDQLRSSAKGAPKRLTREEVLRRFDANVAEMAGLAKARGVPLVLCALPRNLLDSPPGSSLPLDDRDFFDAWLRFDRGDYAGAERLLRLYVAARPERAFGAFYLAKSLRAQGKTDEAREFFLRAAEFSAQDGVRPSMNAHLRERAGRDGLLVADLEKAFAAASEDGLPGSDQLDDNIHWHTAMNPLITLTVVKAASKAVGAQWKEEALDAELKRLRALKITAAERLLRARRALFNGVWTWAWDKQRNDEVCVEGLDLAWRLDPELVEELGSEKGRRRVRKELSEFIWVKNDVGRLDGLWPLVFDNLGEMYRRRKNWTEASRFFDASLARDAQRPLTRLRRAMARRAAGDLKGAREDLESIRERGAEFPEIGYYGTGE